MLLSFVRIEIFVYKYDFREGKSYRYRSSQFIEGWNFKYPRAVKALVIPRLACLMAALNRSPPSATLLLSLSLSEAPSLPSLFKPYQFYCHFHFIGGKSEQALPERSDNISAKRGDDNDDGLDATTARNAVSREREKSATSFIDHDSDPWKPLISRTSLSLSLSLFVFSFFILFSRRRSSL